MSGAPLLDRVLADGAVPGGGSLVKIGGGLVVAGVVGLGLGFAAAGDRGAAWTGLLTATAIVAGVAMVGPLLSAIFQMTGARWGRVYRRLAEGSVVLMPVALVGVVILMAGGNDYLPWVHDHPHLGGKAVWLTRGFWDARLLLFLAASYTVGLAFVRLSLRRDFCLPEVRARYKGRIADLVSKGLTDANASDEAARCERRMSTLAPVVAIVYGLAFTVLGIDLIMALEPDWFSTLFGAWYFIGNVFVGLALLAIGSVAFARRSALGHLFSRKRQSDLATLLIAFCLINVDFFWNQYLTIWYANLPEETFYLIERTADTSLPWRNLSFVSLAAFFLIPFTMLLLRRVKRSGALLTAVAAVSLAGVFLARFIEIAPALLETNEAGGVSVAMPLVSSALIFAGFLGGGLLLYQGWLAGAPAMAVGDEILAAEAAGEGGHP
ncbi:MAG: hypothetical protein JRI23_35225 [Deltaproteobacteria bacterium]|jgi:hypothetical protein|nr:hypothetical protein [Deltaproteobacteria bacterium]MBW2537571.1 hypothetical protein [Deltaproteobacteria bacterium]